MIVRQFLQWVRSAPAAERAEASGALVRAYLFSNLSADDLAAAEGAMMMLLDDPSPLVRQALAESLASSPDAPPSAVLALAGDQPEVAAIVLERSPLLVDADLVDMAATGTAAHQVAIARRIPVPRSVAAAIAEVGAAEACLVLVENPDADIATFSLDRITERFGHLAAIREALFAREDLPATTRQALVVKLSETLGSFVASRRWLESGRARRVAQEACEKATVTLAGNHGRDQLGRLIRHLRESGQLNAGLILRALLSGNVLLFEQALAELSGFPASRVSDLVHDRRGSGLRALYERCGLPASAFPAVQAAVETLHETGFAGDIGGATRLRRRMVERVLTRCENEPSTEIEPLLTLLRRFATEAAREEARLYCEELAAA